MLLFISLVYLNILTAKILTYDINYSLFTTLIDTVLLGLGVTYAFIRYKGGKWNEFIFSFHVIPYVFIRHIGFIIGFLKFPKSPRKYPTDAKIITDKNGGRV